MTPEWEQDAARAFDDEHRDLLWEQQDIGPDPTWAAIVSHTDTRDTAPPEHEVLPTSTEQEPW
jgi:hypothetical protein